jgi:hypothetical protein
MTDDEKAALHREVEFIGEIVDLFDDNLPVISRATLNYLRDKFEADWQHYQERRRQAASETRTEEAK